MSLTAFSAPRDENFTNYNIFSYFLAHRGAPLTLSDTLATESEEVVAESITEDVKEESLTAEERGSNQASAGSEEVVTEAEDVVVSESESGKAGGAKDVSEVSESETIVESPAEKEKTESITEEVKETVVEETSGERRRRNSSNDELTEEENDRLNRALDSLMEVLSIPDDTTGYGEGFTPDSLATDSTMADTVVADTAPPKPLFDDVITFRSEDSIRLHLPSKEIFLYKTAKVTYITTELEADFISLDMNSNSTYAEGVLDTVTGEMVGLPHFRDSGQEFDGKNLRYNFKTGKGLVSDIITQEGDGYIQGQITKKMTDSVYCVKKGLYTTCDQHDHPHYYIYMSEAKYIKGDKVVSKFVNVVLEDVHLPVALPFGFFPMSNAGTSGVIMPTYSEEKIRGFALKDGGYYWAVSQYFDLSLVGTIYTNGSWGLDISSNYKKRYKFAGDFKFGFSRNIYGEKTDDDYSKSTSWSVAWTHSQDSKANPYSSFSASVDISSANNNYYNSESITDIANQRKSSSISYSRKWPDRPVSLSGSFSHNQNSSDTTISMTLPSLTMKVSTVYPFRKKTHVGKYKWYENIGFTYTLEMKNNVSTKEYLLGESFKNMAKDWKNGFKHTIPLSLSLKPFTNFTITPSFTYNGIGVLKTIKRYWQEDTSYSQGGYVKTDTIMGFRYGHNYSGSISASYAPTIYGMYTNKKEDAKFVALRHVIRPTLSVSYTPKMGVPHSKYYHTYYNPNTEKDVEYNIFDGQPYSLSSNSKQAGSVSLSIDNNVEMKMRDYKDTTNTDGVKKITILESLKASASYDMFADSLNFSTISLSARTKLFNKLTINLSATLDPYKITKDAVRINKYNGGVGRLTKVSATASFSLSADKGKNKELKNERLNGHYDEYMDFDVPWNFSFNYSFSLSRSYSRNTDENAKGPKVRTNISQIINVNGDVSLTERWKIGITTGFDIQERKITSTSFNIARNLHCWNMTFNCIPFGTHQSYNFQINVSSSLLQDLKLTKRDSWYDKNY